MPADLLRQRLLNTIIEGIARLNLGRCQAFGEIAGSVFLGSTAHSLDAASRSGAGPALSAQELVFVDTPGGAGNIFLLSLTHSFLLLRGRKV